MELTNTLQLIYVICAIVIGATTSIISFINAAKAKSKAKTTEEKEIANSALLEQTYKLITEAETFYKSLDSVLKSTTGESAGAFKKESVMAKLQTYATENSYKFDKEFWSNKVDEIVSLTKSVN